MYVQFKICNVQIHWIMLYLNISEFGFYIYIYWILLASLGSSIGCLGNGEAYSPRMPCTKDGRGRELSVPWFVLLQESRWEQNLGVMSIWYESWSRPKKAYSHLPFPNKSRHCCLILLLSLSICHWWIFCILKQSSLCHYLSSSSNPLMYIFA